MTDMKAFKICGILPVHHGRTLSWLAHGCSEGTDKVRVDVIMVGPWTLRVSGRGLTGRYHGWVMDALRTRIRSGGRYHGWQI